MSAQRRGDIALVVSEALTARLSDGLEITSPGGLGTEVCVTFAL